MKTKSAVGVILSTAALALSLTSVFAAHTPFSDANWISMGGSLPGADGPVYATAVDASGNLYVAGSFTVVGDVLATNIAKWNGSNWSALGTGFSTPLCCSYSEPLVSALVISGNDLYVAGRFSVAGGIPATNIAKWNGSSWSSLGSGLGGVPSDQLRVSALTVSGNDLYVGGWFKTAGGVGATNVAKWNGSSWSALGSGMNGSVHALAMSGGNLFAGGFFTTAGGITASNIARWNGSTWAALGSGIAGVPFGVVPVSALAASGNNVYAGGTFTRAGGVAATNIAKWNGSSWSALGLGLNGGLFFGEWSSVSVLATSGSDVYAGGAFTRAGGVAATNIAKWNGSSWSALGSGTFRPLTLAVSGSNLFAGGQFIPPIFPAFRIARWNGSSWSALNPGMNNTVSALAVVGNDVYAGGSFTTIGGGTNANYVARWNGNSWSALGSGMNGTVSALAVSGSGLYAAGYFTTAGGIPARKIASWNGTDWSALGSGINGSGVIALAVLGTDLYAGGFFTNAGGTAAHGIAKWNGSTWSALLETGMVSPRGIWELTVCGSNLLAAGSFSTNGEQSAHHVARWDGSSWTLLGSAFGNPINALAVVGTNLYAGTDLFGTVDGSLIAKWDGSSWSAVGSGLWGNYVDALAVSGSNLYAGGLFTTVNGVALNHIAKWDGSSWSALGSGMNGAVSALAVLGNDLHAGGAFTTAGGKVSVNLARARLSFTPDNLALRANVAHTNTLTFAGVPDFPYFVQYATNLSGSPWFTLSTNAPAANGVGTALDSTAIDAHRFYRVGFQE